MHNLLTRLAIVYNDTPSEYGCFVNGEPVSCTEAGKVVAAILIPFLLVFAVLTVFWIISLIHLVKHEDVPNRTLWIILHFVGLGPLAGIIYFFVVKRPYDRSHLAGTNNVPPANPVSDQQSSQPPVATPQPTNDNNQNQPPAI